MSDNRIELEQVVHTYRTSHQSGRLAERSGWWTKSQSSLLTYVGPSPRSPLLILLENLFTLRRKVEVTYPGDMWRSTFKDQRWRNAVSLLNRNSWKITVLLYEPTKGKSGIIFVSAQGLSGIVWLIIAFRVPQTPDINLPHNSVATIQCYERFIRLG